MTPDGSAPTEFDRSKHLRDGLAAARWTIDELWLASVALGGSFGHGAVAAITSGDRQPARGEYGVLSTALNEHFMDHGRDHPMLSWSDLHSR